LRVQPKRYLPRGAIRRTLKLLGHLPISNNAKIIIYFDGHSKVDGPHRDWVDDSVD